MTKHLFKDKDLEPLENHPQQGEYNILIVGTFNGDIEGNLATWFYGRPENEFWCLLPRMLGKESLHPVDRDEHIDELTLLWKQFCRENKIIIVDLFKEILITLPNHSDKNLQTLQRDQYIPFDFKKAFANCNFKKVMFTWKGMKNNVLKTLKLEYIDFFKQRGSSVAHLLTPSLAYSKSRYFKLKQWKEAYINHE
jgi:G:T/U-mismatch repair DNA glycosylase